MKKSQLRKIIKESIKELMTEQASVYTKCKYNKCSGGGFGWQYMKINGQTPEAGNTFMIGNTAFFTYVCWPNDTSNSGGDYDCASNSGNYPNGFQQGDCPACESMNGGGTTGGGSQYPPYTCNYGCPGSTTPCTTYGCTDPTALNYNSTILPNCDDGSCIPGNTVFGCMDSTASNYDPNATIDDGSCITTTSGCTQPDFDYGASCGQTHLDPAPGNAPSWTSWLNNQWNAFNGNAGCYQFGAIQNWISNQLSQGTNNQGTPWTSQQIARKQAKLDWAACMQQECNC